MKEKSSLIRKICSAFGYELIATRKGPTLSSHLDVVLKRYEIDVVIDVGANEGQFASMLRRNGFRGQIYSFEPVSETYRRLAERAKGDKCWHLFQFALGDVKEQKAINLSVSSDLNSLLHASDIGKDWFPKIESTSQEVIQIDTLDSFLEREKIPASARIFLKMDTQGYDMNVFAGAQNSLRRISAILSELSFIPLYESCPSFIDSFSIFESHGFKVSGLYPVSRAANQAIIEMDCVLINSEISVRSLGGVR